jgi:FKBP-type peptidyl-prolyl cis-trans isomerase
MCLPCRSRNSSMQHFQHFVYNASHLFSPFTIYSYTKTLTSKLNTSLVHHSNTIKDKLEAAGREMLANMAEEKDAVTLDSGVVLHVLEHGPDGPGKGVRATKASTVKIQYHGTLADGTVFDSTMVSGEPVKLPLAAVIAGWRDGVLKMHEGETAMLGIPPEQGYGVEGTPDGSIPGGSTVFFKVQLLEVMSAGIGGERTLLGADGNKMSREKGSGGLLGADGKPFA